MEMKYLESVGSYLDTTTGTVYPAFENDTPDLDSPISLVEGEISKEWLDGLSKSDYVYINQFI